MLRAARPLRFLRRFKSLKRVVQTLVTAAAPLAYTVLIAVVLMLMFAILGVSLLKGRYHWCPDDTTSTLDEAACNAAASWDDGNTPTLARGWSPRPINFDNSLEAMLALFFIAMSWGWGELMQIAMDSTAPGEPPEKDGSRGFAVFFIVWYILGNFMLVNIFVGVLTDSYNRVVVLELNPTDETGDDDDLNLAVARGRGKANTEKMIVALKGQHGEETSEAGTKADQENFLFVFVTHMRFEILINIVILLNVVAMAIEHHGQSEDLSSILDLTELCFASIFALEALLKLCGMGPVKYWNSGWNRFDLFLVITSIVQVVLQSISADMFNATVSRHSLLRNHRLRLCVQILRVLRLVRIARLLRLLRLSQGLQSLLSALEAALVQIVNILALMGIIWFMYAAAGMEIYGKIECPHEVYPCLALNERTNFSNFLRSSLTLVQIFSGDTTLQIFLDTLRVSPQCDDSPTCKYGGNCCSSAGLSAFYFISFGLLSQLILVNVIVAMMLSNLTSSLAALHAREILEATNNVTWEDSKLRRMADVLPTDFDNPMDAEENPALDGVEIAQEPSPKQQASNSAKVHPADDAGITHNTFEKTTDRLKGAGVI